MEFGKLALEHCHVELPLRVLESRAGWYIGTWGTKEDLLGPVSRESAEYFQSQNTAKEALATGNWTQRDKP